MPVLNINAVTAPGTYISEQTQGVIPATLATFDRCYMLGSSASGTAKKPTQVISAEDFTNQFGSSPSLNAVKLFFANIPAGVLYFTKVPAAGAAPTAAEWVDAINTSFDPELPQGFLIAPEAFSTLTAQSDRTSVATAMENLCATEGYDWMAMVDSGPWTGASAIDTTVKAQTEGQLYTTARGHLAYFFPYLIDLNDNKVPPSSAVAGIALRRYREQGFNQPPAGAKFPIRGAKDVAVKVTKSQQGVINPLGINCIRNLPNTGVVVWGARTRSSNPFYRFVNTRIILNVIVGTLRDAFDTEIFSAVDGQGVLFARVRETCEAVLYQIYDGGGLFGATPAEAFRVICDRGNNPSLALEDGVVRADIYCSPAPTLEKLLIQLSRVAIGGVTVATGQG